ncbi:MAG: acyl carrier protein [Alcanivorax sp.]|uniref:acyl carrier protein n=1 Tax=Alcanivorax sp. TaxID=1872427 RepID=UPI003DA6E958
MTVAVDKAGLHHVVAELAFMDKNEISNDTALFSGGLIDSVSLLEIVVYLEKTYGIKVAGTELALENFDSLDNISGFIAKKLS